MRHRFPVPMIARRSRAATIAWNCAGVTQVEPTQSSLLRYLLIVVRMTVVMIGEAGDGRERDVKFR